MEFTFIVDEEQEELETFSLELRRTSGIQPTAFFNGTLDFTIGAGNRVRGGGGGGGGLATCSHTPRYSINTVEWQLSTINFIRCKSKGGGDHRTPPRGLLGIQGPHSMIPQE